MSESTERASVTDLKADETPPSAEEEGKSGGGGVWKITTLALLVLLLVSGGINVAQWNARGSLESEATLAAETLAGETERADLAEASAAAMRSTLTDLHTHATALQASLGEIVASAGSALDDDAALLAEGSDPSALDAMTEAAGEALDAVTEAASEGASAVVDSATSLLEGDDAAELPDVAAAPEADDSNSVADALSSAWTTTRDGVSSLVERVKGE